MPRSAPRGERAPRRCAPTTFPPQRTESCPSCMRSSALPKFTRPLRAKAPRAGRCVSRSTGSSPPTLPEEGPSMTEDEILAACTRILRDILADESIVLTMDTKREQVSNWDSFGYVTFIVGVEMEFGVKFGVAEVESFASVGAIVRRTKALLPPS